jgi:hypothetical protein
LSELRSLPADTVKIDRSFLARHGGTQIGSDGEAMLSGIVSLAHELKRAVVAEGVESEADAQLLARIGCEFGQGYYFSPPLDGAAALDYIARHYNITATPRTLAEHPTNGVPMTIKAGDKIPSATLMEMQDGKPRPSRPIRFSPARRCAVRPARRLHAHLFRQACAGLCQQSRRDQDQGRGRNRLHLGQ